MESQKSLGEDWLLWVLLFGALILAAAYYFFVPAGTQQTEPPSWLFTGTDPKSITELRRLKGEKLLFEVKRSSNDRNDQTWDLSNPESVELDQTAVDRWVDTIISPGISQRFKASPGSTYGISDTSVRIEVVQGNNVHRLYVGESTPTGSGTYLRYGDAQDAPVFVLTGGVEDQLDVSLYDVREKALFDRTLKELQTIRLTSNGESVKYSRSNGKWRMTSPAKRELTDTDNRTIDDNLRQVLMLSAQSFYDEGPPDEYKPVEGSVTLGFAGGSVDLKIGPVYREQRLLRKGEEVVIGVADDPVKWFNELPKLPKGWPEPKTEKSSNKPAPPSRSGRPGQPGMPGMGSSGS